MEADASGADKPVLTQIERYSILVLAVATFASVWLFYDDYGITWDESVQSRYGALVLDYFRSGGQDQRCNEYLNLRYYGPLFEGLAAASAQATGRDLFATRHFLTGITAGLTVVGLMVFVRLWGIPYASVLAALVLLVTPRFIGHAFNNSKDMPFACAFTWAMVALAWLVVSPSLSWRRVLLCGLAFGCALSLRVGGMLLYGYAALAIGVLWWQQRLEPQSEDSEPLAVQTRLLAYKYVTIVLVAWVVMVAFWPWAHQSIIAHPLQALRGSVQFAVEKRMLFAGETISSLALPRSYLVQYLMITTPLALLGLLAMGVAFVAMGWRCPRQRILAILLGLWLCFPIVYFFIARPNAYDGIRHFLFVLPAGAALAGLGAAKFIGLFNTRNGRTLAVGALSLPLAWPIHHIVNLHPYQSSYFNSVVGGVAGAVGRYELDYWASSYREAGEWLAANAVKQAERPLHILVAGNTHIKRCLQHYLPDDVRVADINAVGIEGHLPSAADYYVALTRHGFAENFPDDPIVHEITRDGAVFAVIRARK